MKGIDLTFGIPMYNAENFIEELLNCFDFTDEFNFEVIIIDDGSIDKSYEICKKFDTPKLKLFKQTNSGVSTTRNNIIDKANGDWITFIDADDLIDFKLYKNVFLNCVKSSKFDYIINSSENIKNKSIGYLIEQEIINSPWSKFYKVELLHNSNIRFNSEFFLGEDLLFNLEYYSVCKSYEILSFDLYKFRKINSQSLTTKYIPNKIKILIHVNDLCLLLGLGPKVNKSLRYIRIKNNYSSIVDLLNFTKYNKKEVIQKIKEQKRNTKFKLLVFSRFRNMIYYYSWFLVPSFLLFHFINIMK